MMTKHTAEDQMMTRRGGDTISLSNQKRINLGNWLTLAGFALTILTLLYGIGEMKGTMQTEIRGIQARQERFEAKQDRTDDKVDELKQDVVGVSTKLDDLSRRVDAGGR